MKKKLSIILILFIFVLSGCVKNENSQKSQANAILDEMIIALEDNDTQTIKSMFSTKVQETLGDELDEQIEFWIMQFAKTDFKNEEQKQRLIDIFINSVFVYEDRLVVFLNFKEGEVALSLDDINERIKKENTHKCECSSLLMIGDPYGSRNDIPTFLNLR